VVLEINLGKNRIKTTVSIYIIIGSTNNNRERLIFFFEKSAFSVNFGFSFKNCCFLGKIRENTQKYQKRLTLFGKF